MDGAFLTRMICGLLLFSAAGCDPKDLSQTLDRIQVAARHVAEKQAASGQKGSRLSPPATSSGTLSPRAHDRIRVATFNIQVLGVSKIQRAEVTAVIADILRQFDVVAIQELRTTDETVMQRLVAEVNAQGHRYDYLVGPRLGRTNSKEQYVFVYDTQRLALDSISVHTINDPHDRMHREPMLARFVALTEPHEQPFSFVLINVHTDPDEVALEVNALDEVFMAARNNGGYEDDIVLLGDLNASVQQLGELGEIPGLQTVVREQTTNTRRSKSYDNILFHREATTEFLGIGGVLDFREVYGLSEEEALKVSDHFPVWAEFSRTEHGRGRWIATQPDAPRER